jgi:hypothetical protein
MPCVLNVFSASKPLFQQTSRLGQVPMFDMSVGSAMLRWPEEMPWEAM